MNNWNRDIIYKSPRYIRGTRYKCTTNTLTDEDTYYKWVEETKEWVPTPETVELFTAFNIFKRGF